MALTEVQSVTKPPKKGGGLLGSVLGGVGGAILGAALAPSTGGASALAAGALAGAGTGMAAGGAVGEMVVPSEGAKQSPVIGQVHGAKPKLTSMADNPEVQLAQIQTAKKLVPGSSMTPDAASQAMSTLDAADKRLKDRLGIGVGNG